MPTSRRSLVASHYRISRYRIGRGNTLTCQGALYLKVTRKGQGIQPVVFARVRRGLNPYQLVVVVVPTSQRSFVASHYRISGYRFGRGQHVNVSRSPLPKVYNTRSGDSTPCILQRSSGIKPCCLLWPWYQPAVARWPLHIVAFLAIESAGVSSSSCHGAYSRGHTRRGPTIQPVVFDSVRRGLNPACVLWP